MIIIILVLCILVVIDSLNNEKKKITREEANHAWDGRKTNASLERNLMDQYIKLGYNIDDAYEKTCKELLTRGFDPTIPKQRYVNKITEEYGYGESKKTHNAYSTRLDNPEKYDSYIVKERRENKRRGLFEGDIYENFPSDATEFRDESVRLIKKRSLRQVGSYIICPGKGTCEIIGYKWYNNNTYVLYKVKRIEDGKIFYVKSDDHNISYL